MSHPYFVKTLAKLSLAILLPYGLQGCATGILTDAGAKVAIVNTISATEVTNFVELGSVECEKRSDLEADPSESCKNDLRNSAAIKGATLVVIENIDHGKCLWPDDAKDCYKIHGRAYRSK